MNATPNIITFRTKWRIMLCPKSQLNKKGNSGSSHGALVGATENARHENVNKTN